MASNQQHGSGGASRSGASDRRAPEWADGLKQLYDSVVEEDLPDAFRDLLDRLDCDDPESASDNDNETKKKGSDRPSPDGRSPAA
ncbi:MAG TPA: NepR family anti-sigma factor [Erythrobacter sp.]|nr:NepR family anti-sigma factor [Erythrobacter sp.]